MIAMLVVLVLVLAAVGLPNLIKYRKERINAKAESMGREKIFHDV